MDLDPNVQVALVSVFATFITTLGIITVAIINNRKERAKAADAGVEAGLDERDVLTRILSLISEKDVLAKENSVVKLENVSLKEDNARLRAENIALTAAKFNDWPDGGNDV